jgi:hypothetical protein
VNPLAEELVARFESLSPYDFVGSILKIEDVNFWDKARKQPRQLYFDGISAKRYSMFNLVDGRPAIRDAKEHGLAHLLEPVHPKKRWIRELWKYLVAKELGLNPEEPSWLDLPAVGQMTASQPFLWFPFRQKDVPWERQIKPFNFLLLAFPKAGLVCAEKIRPIAPYERDSAKWSALPWIDLSRGQPIQLDFGPSHRHVAGTVPVKTFRDVLEEYATHPEAKGAAANGRPAGRDFRGELRRLNIDTGRIRHVGKESNELDVAQVLGTADEEILEYEPALAAVFLDLADLSDAEIASATGISRQQVHNLRTGRTGQARRHTLDRLRSVQPRA